VKVSCVRGNDPKH